MGGVYPASVPLSAPVAPGPPSGPFKGPVFPAYQPPPGAANSNTARALRFAKSVGKKAGLLGAAFAAWEIMELLGKRDIMSDDYWTIFCNESNGTGPYFIGPHVQVCPAGVIGWYKITTYPPPTTAEAHKMNHTGYYNESAAWFNTQYELNREWPGRSQRS